MKQKWNGKAIVILVCFVIMCAAMLRTAQMTSRLIGSEGDLKYQLLQKNRELQVLQSKNQRLVKSIAAQSEGAPGLYVRRVEPISRKMDPEGRVWGDFTVKVTVENTTAEPVAARIVAMLLVDNPAGSAKKGLDSTQVHATGAQLAPGKLTTVELGAFSPLPSEQVHELVVKAIASQIFGDATPAVGEEPTFRVSQGKPWVGRVWVRLRPGETD